jgi:hypothetical protein
MEHRTCEGCSHNRSGRCNDWTVFGTLGGDLITDYDPRECYEVQGRDATSDFEEFIQDTFDERARNRKRRLEDHETK